jgi:drug/metabolite transporter (DMT)-like permease
MEMVAALVLWGSAVLIAVVGVWIYPLLRGFGWVQGVAVFCVANALVFLGAGLIGGRSAWDWREGWGGTVVVGVEVMFLVGALRGWESVRVGARFLVVPLVTIVEGLVLLRPELTGRMVVGMALLAGGAGWLVWSRAERPTLSLR